VIGLILSFNILFSGIGIEKIQTPFDTFFYRLGCQSRLVVVPKPVCTDDISPISVSAGEDIATCVGSHVALTAAKTHDPLGSKLSFRWFFYSKPIGSNAQLWYSDTMNSEFITDHVGEYYITLEVSAEDGRSGADTIVVIVEDCNGYPQAVISTSKTVLQPGEVRLSAEGSHCINDEIISYKWTIVEKPDGSQAAVSGGVEAYMILDRIGLYRVCLTVRSMRGFSDSQTIDIHCIDGFIPPVYAYSQELTLRGVLGSVKKLSILFEFPNGTGDLTAVAVYGKRNGQVELIATVKLLASESSFRKVIDFYDYVYVMGMINEKMVLVKYCDRF